MIATGRISWLGLYSHLVWVESKMFFGQEQVEPKLCLHAPIVYIQGLTSLLMLPRFLDVRFFVHGGHARRRFYGVEEFTNFHLFTYCKSQFKQLNLGFSTFREQSSSQRPIMRWVCLFMIVQQIILACAYFGAIFLPLFRISSTLKPPIFYL